MTTLLRRLTRHVMRLGTRCPGWLPAARKTRARALAVVMYHGVTAKPLPVENWCHLDLQEFARQIEFLAAHYTILPLREVVDRLERGAPLPNFPAVITFDDGFRSVLAHALPVLQRFWAPATVFVVTGLVGSRQPPWTDQLYDALVHTSLDHVALDGRRWELTSPALVGRAHRKLNARLKGMDQRSREQCLGQLYEDLEATSVPADSPLATLDWSEIEQLARTGLVDIGSHTHNHPILSRCPVEVQEAELRTSRDLVRERLGRCDLFAYPNGAAADFTPETQSLLRQLGYRCGLATEPGLNRRNADRFALRRVNVAADTTMAEFERLMVGL